MRCSICDSTEFEDKISDFGIPIIKRWYKLFRPDGGYDDCCDRCYKAIDDSMPDLYFETEEIEGDKP